MFACNLQNERLAISIAPMVFTNLLAVCFPHLAEFFFWHPGYAASHPQRSWYRKAQFLASTASASYCRHIQRPGGRPMAASIALRLSHSTAQAGFGRSCPNLPQNVLALRVLEWVNFMFFRAPGALT
jgi:hypothetical protein